MQLSRHGRCSGATRLASKRRVRTRQSLRQQPPHLRGTVGEQGHVGVVALSVQRVLVPTGQASGGGPVGVHLAVCSRDPRAGVEKILTGLGAWRCWADLLRAAAPRWSAGLAPQHDRGPALAGRTPQHIRARVFQGLRNMRTLLRVEQVKSVADAVQGNVAGSLGLFYTNLRRLGTKGGQSGSTAFQGPRAPAC